MRSDEIPWHPMLFSSAKSLLLSCQWLTSGRSLYQNFNHHFSGHRVLFAPIQMYFPKVAPILRYWDANQTAPYSWTCLWRWCFCSCSCNGRSNACQVALCLCLFAILEDFRTGKNSPEETKQEKGNTELVEMCLATSSYILASMSQRLLGQHGSIRLRCAKMIFASSPIHGIHGDKSPIFSDVLVWQVWFSKDPSPHRQSPAGAGARAGAAGAAWKWLIERKRETDLYILYISYRILSYLIISVYTRSDVYF